MCLGRVGPSREPCTLEVEDPSRSRRSGSTASEGTVICVSVTWDGTNERVFAMKLASGGEDWIEVKVLGHHLPPESAWSVEARLGGSHYKLSDAFPTKATRRGARCCWRCGCSRSSGGARST